MESNLFNVRLTTDDKCDKTCRLTAMDTLKIVATLIVFFLHTYIFSMQRGFVIDDRTWLLKTPAWAAVWIFFFLSGLNIGRGFVSGKYKDNGKYTLRSTVRFYLQRFIKIGIPTWIFAFLAMAILEPANLIQNPSILWKTLTFTYGNTPSSTAIGATWYVSTLMWLYLIAPVLMMMVETIAEKFKNSGLIVTWVIVLIAGGVFREMLRRQGVDWSSKVYVPFYCNIDIYLCGLICSKVSINKVFNKFAFRIGAVILLLAVITANIRIYYLSDWNADLLWFYCYKMPSIYIIALTVFAVAFRDEDRGGRLTGRAVLRNPLLLLKVFGQISFEFYLVHSLVICQIAPHINAASPLRLHIKLLLCAFIVSSVLAAMMHLANEQLTNRFKKK